MKKLNINRKYQSPKTLISGITEKRFLFLYVHEETLIMIQDNENMRSYYLCYLNEKDNSGFRSGPVFPKTMKEHELKIKPKTFGDDFFNSRKYRFDKKYLHKTEISKKYFKEIIKKEFKSPIDVKKEFSKFFPEAFI